MTNPPADLPQADRIKEFFLFNLLNKLSEATTTIRQSSIVIRYLSARRILRLAFLSGRVINPGRPWTNLSCSVSKVKNRKQALIISGLTVI